jgi:hypothetical protein
MPEEALAGVRDILLTRRGLVFVSSLGEPLAEDHVLAVEIELAALGYALSSRLRARLSRCSLEELAAFGAWACEVFATHLGGNLRHVPLFRLFPDGIPDDTFDLWWKKVLVHFLQAEGQPCLFCRRVGFTHVLNPCRHVVCDHCFDGSNYSACPVCEHHVDRSSPFFGQDPERGKPSEQVIFKLLDLGDDMAAEAQSLFVSFCERTQAMTAVDRSALTAIVGEYKPLILSWLPRTIPLRENVAIVFGTLLRGCDASDALPHAARYVSTATDVLRLIAVLSGADGSLVRETILRPIERTEGPSRFWGEVAKRLGAQPPGPTQKVVYIPLHVCRFKIAKLRRPLRRALLSLLDGMDADRLTEDMLRHRSYWVWVGEFLHPHEYAARFPKVANAFQVVRKKAPDGTRAAHFQSWNGKLEKTIRAKDIRAMLEILADRPGELARRLDFALRTAASDDDRGKVAATFCPRVTAFATPVLLTLRSHLSTRVTKGGVRVYWPKGRVAKGVSTADNRAVLPRHAVEPLVRAIDSELLRRFSAKPAFEECLVDDALWTVMAPFNERTASQSAISLAQGSCVSIPSGKLVRLFLHWCQPRSGATTDLDLSVAFYDNSWNYMGVCSYYQLKLAGKQGDVIAKSAGDLRDAPWPDGATEFVDIERDQARAEGIRYAVMVVNNFAGMPFSLLERGFAGLMLRDDPGGQHFDPRTVQMKFRLDGSSGIFLPLVLDMSVGELHWLDVHTKGQFEMNNVETSRPAISRICPDLMAYFRSGARASMLDLALLHAAARCQRVSIRKREELEHFVRGQSEGMESFHDRLTSMSSDTQSLQLPRAEGPPLMAFLYRGDIDLPRGSAAYVLFRERVIPSIAASDLIS